MYGAAVARYHERVSGPLLDRIDIHLEMPPVRYAELTDQTRPLIIARTSSPDCGITTLLYACLSFQT